MLNKKKVAVYIDGFNLYHGLRNLGSPGFKWLNLKRLCELYIDPQREVISEVYYFSAYACHIKDPTVVPRHKTYVKALETTGVKFIEGKFKRRDIYCTNRLLAKSCFRYEEKETDVNLAISFIRDVIRRKFHSYFIITNDTDIAPAIRMAKTENPNAKVKVITPPTFRLHNDLKSAAKQKKPINIRKQHLKLSLLPKSICLSSGKLIKAPTPYLISQNNEKLILPV